MYICIYIYKYILYVHIYIHKYTLYVFSLYIVICSMVNKNIAISDILRKCKQTAIK